MAKTYKKYGVTTGGYRGERAILQERVIEGLEAVAFTDQVLQLEPTSPQTLYLTNNNMASGNYIVLPKASNLWPNWQVVIINESSITCPIYYYTEDYTQLNLFKEATGGNMITCILLDDTTVEGTWTTLRTVEQSSVDLLDRYTSDVLEEVEVTWNELAQDTSTIVVPLGNVLTGTSVKSVYLKTTEAFSGDSEHSVTLNVQIGKGAVVTGTYDYSTDPEYDADYFIGSYDMTTAISDTNFTKDLFDEILSTSADKQVLATFTGTNLQYLTAGSIKIVVEKAKLIDPTILKNPIVQTQLPIGIIMNYAFPDIPEGYWRLDGTVFPNAASAIPQFVKKLNSMNNQQPANAKLIVGIDEWTQIKNTYGSCSKFAWVGSGLKFPEINCFVQGLNSMNQLTQMTQAGLPDIVAQMSNENGAINNSMASGSAGWESVYWHASAWNPIFGRSNTVQPDSVKYPYIISVYNKIQNASSIVLDELIEDSVNKANISLDNLNADGRQIITNACMPDYASVITGTMPSHGSWVQVLKNSFVEVNGTDPYLIDARAYVSPDNGTTTYQVGYFYSDFNGNTRGTSFTFFIPAGWYFKCTFENGSAYYIYPLEGVQ